MQSNHLELHYRGKVFKAKQVERGQLEDDTSVPGDVVKKVEATLNPDDQHLEHDHLTSFGGLAARSIAHCEHQLMKVGLVFEN